MAKTVTPEAAKDAIYLSKNGATFGPFSQEEFEDLRVSGELAQYSWRWDRTSNQWVPLVHAEPPTEVPVERQEGGSPEEETELEHRKSDTRLWNVQVICHDQRSIVSGSITAASPSGCTLITSLGRGDLPPFRKGAKTLLNLLRQSSGHTQDFDAVVNGYHLKEGKWEFELGWSQLPDLLEPLTKGN